MKHSEGWDKWDLHCEKKIEDFDPVNVIYLTAEADEVISEVEPGTIYVIGGMVDRNRLPGICHERAKEMNLKTRRIPIRENIKFNARCVLTVNHVFEILVNRMNGKCWRESLLSVLPNRKIELSETVTRDNNAEGASPSALGSQTVTAERLSKNDLLIE